MVKLCLSTQVSIEFGTDWVKFCLRPGFLSLFFLGKQYQTVPKGIISASFSIETGHVWAKTQPRIMKFSELPVAVLESYQQVLMADILVCRMGQNSPFMPFRGP